MHTLTERRKSDRHILISSILVLQRNISCTCTTCSSSIRGGTTLFIQYSLQNSQESVKSVFLTPMVVRKKSTFMLQVGMFKRCGCALITLYSGLTLSYASHTFPSRMLACSFATTITNQTIITNILVIVRLHGSIILKLKQRNIPSTRVLHLNTIKSRLHSVCHNYIIQKCSCQL